MTMNQPTVINNPKTVATTQSSIVDIIARAAESPNFDVDKLERLIALKDADDTKQAVYVFNTALSAAQGEMETISNDASNPQTRSRYATFAQLDRAIRPIYTRHGFGIQFTEEPSPSPDKIRVVAFATNGSETRRYMRDIPVTSQGIKGASMMTPTHANMSAFTYGRRNLLVMIFNLSSDDDDDGNAASRRTSPPSQQYRQAREPKVTEWDEPFKCDRPATDATYEAWRPWAEDFVAHVRASKSRAEVDRWLSLNNDVLVDLKEREPQMFAMLENALKLELERHANDPQ